MSAQKISIAQWQIVLALVEQDHTRGNEIYKNVGRPWIVVSDNRIASAEKLFVGVPISSQEERRTDGACGSFRFPIEARMVTPMNGSGGLTEDGVALCEQMRALSLKRLTRRDAIGVLHFDHRAALEACIKASLRLR